MAKKEDKSKETEARIKGMFNDCLDIGFKSGYWKGKFNMAGCVYLGCAVGTFIQIFSPISPLLPFMGLLIGTLVSLWLPEEKRPGYMTFNGDANAK